MSPGFDDSINCSSTACSSSVSTSLRVETRCCALTTRHGVARSGASLESPAHCVQILDDIDEPFDSLDAIDGRAAKVDVVGVQPRARLRLVATDERIEAAEDAEKQQRQLAFLARRFEAA